VCTVSSCLAQRCIAKPSSPLLSAARPTLQPFRRTVQKQSLHRSLVTYAKQGEGNSQLPALLGVANGITNSLASVVPATVPRPVAKLAVLGIGSIITLWVFGKVVSTLFTFALVAGAAYVFLKSKSGSSSGTNQDTDGGDDSLASARRIMDKYK